MFLVFSVVQSLLFTGVLVLTIMGISHSHKGGLLAITIIVWILFVGHAIYGAIMLHKDRKDRETGRGIYEKTPIQEIFPNGQLPSTFSMSGAHPGNEQRHSRGEVYA